MSSASSAPPAQHQAAFFVSKEAKRTEVAPRSFSKPLGSDEVLIQITSAAINPVDWKMRDWGIFVDKYPALPGSDAAGRVVQRGKDVERVKVGDRVFFQGYVGKEDGATFQEYAQIGADLVGLTPDDISDDEAAGVSLAAIASLTGLYAESGFGITPAPWEQGGQDAAKGKSIIILGGSSSVGQYAIQLARLSGFSTIVTGASAKHEQLLKSLGATHFLDRTKSKPEDYAQAAISDGHPFAMVFDPIASNETQLEGVSILHKGLELQRRSDPQFSPWQKVSLPANTVVTVYTADENVQTAAKSTNGQEGGEVHVKTVWGIGSAPELRPLAGAFMLALGGSQGWLAKKQFVPNKPLVVEGGLSALDKALDRNRDGVSGEKVILHVSPSSA